MLIVPVYKIVTTQGKKKKTVNVYFKNERLRILNFFIKIWEMKLTNEISVAVYAW